MTHQQQTNQQTKTTEYTIGLGKGKDAGKFALYRTRTWQGHIRFTDAMFSSTSYDTVAIMLQAVGS